MKDLLIYIIIWSVGFGLGWFLAALEKSQNQSDNGMMNILTIAAALEGSLSRGALMLLTIKSPKLVTL